MSAPRVTDVGAARLMSAPTTRRRFRKLTSKANFSFRTSPARFCAHGFALLVFVAFLSIASGPPGAVGDETK